MKPALSPAVEPAATNDNAPDVLTVDEAVELLRMGRNAVYAQCAKNAIPHRRIGKSIRFSRVALLRWLEGDHAK